MKSILHDLVSKLSSLFRKKETEVINGLQDAANTTAALIDGVDQHLEQTANIMEQTTCLNETINWENHQLNPQQHQPIHHHSAIISTASQQQKLLQQQSAVPEPCTHPQVG